MDVGQVLFFSTAKSLRAVFPLFSRAVFCFSFNTNRRFKLDVGQVPGYYVFYDLYGWC
jgi:hypothetical protein